MIFPLYPSVGINSLNPQCANIFIICHIIGKPPISIMGFGKLAVSSPRRDPRPPASIITFNSINSFYFPQYQFFLKTKTIKYFHSLGSKLSLFVRYLSCFHTDTSTTRHFHYNFMYYYGEFHNNINRCYIVI